MLKKLKSINNFNKLSITSFLTYIFNKIFLYGNNLIYLDIKNLENVADKKKYD